MFQAITSFVRARVPWFWPLGSASELEPGFKSGLLFLWHLAWKCRIRLPVILIMTMFALDARVRIDVIHEEDEFEEDNLQDEEDDESVNDSLPEEEEDSDNVPELEFIAYNYIPEEGEGPPEWGEDPPEGGEDQPEQGDEFFERLHDDPWPLEDLLRRAEQVEREEAAREAADSPLVALTYSRGR